MKFWEQGEDTLFYDNLLEKFKTEAYFEEQLKALADSFEYRQRLMDKNILELQAGFEVAIEGLKEKRHFSKLQLKEHYEKQLRY